MLLWNCVYVTLWEASNSPFGLFGVPVEMLLCGNALVISECYINYKEIWRCNHLNEALQWTYW